MCNKVILDIVNKDKDTMIFKLEEMIGVIDLRLLGTTRSSKEYCNRT